MALNHYAINQVIGGKMVVGGRPRFGRFGLLGATGEMLKHRPRPGARVAFDIDADRAVYEAFTKVHGGASAETVLLDDLLARKFHLAARKFGAHASAADLNRRLLNIRKHPARYRNHGIVLPPATKITPHPSIVPQYAHIIEFALARLRSRYGVSIDDVLIDPVLLHEYEEMVGTAAPSLSSLDVRLAALYIRKTRYIGKNQGTLIESLNSDRIEGAFASVGTVDSVESKSIPEGEGLIEILEDGRHLYVSRNENLRAAVTQIASESTLKFMSNDFWRPRPDQLMLRVFAGGQYLKVNVSQWQLKLIKDKKPVFNWPIAA